MTQVADKLAHLQFLNNREQPEGFSSPTSRTIPSQGDTLKKRMVCESWRRGDSNFLQASSFWESLTLMASAVKV